MYQQALAILREVGDRAGEGTTINNIGKVYKAQGRYAEALGMYQQALAILREVGDRAGEGTTINNIGEVYHTQGRYAEAIEIYQKALTIRQEVGDEATGMLMAAFHRHLREGMGPAAALRAAQEEVRANEKWAAPYYWAGVQVIGDGGEAREEKVTPMAATPETAAGEVTEEARQGRRWVLWVGGTVVGMGVAGAALFALRRRNP
jgi:tetratricopeptide (TPR) repeat protein